MSSTIRNLTIYVLWMLNMKSVSAEDNGPDSGTAQRISSMESTICTPPCQHTMDYFECSVIDVLSDLEDTLRKELDDTEDQGTTGMSHSADIDNTSAPGSNSRKNSSEFENDRGYCTPLVAAWDMCYDICKKVESDLEDILHNELEDTKDTVSGLDHNGGYYRSLDADWKLGFDMHEKVASNLEDIQHEVFENSEDQEITGMSHSVDIGDTCAPGSNPCKNSSEFENDRGYYTSLVAYWKWSKDTQEKAKSCLPSPLADMIQSILFESQYTDARVPRDMIIGYRWIDKHGMKFFRAFAYALYERIIKNEMCRRKIVGGLRQLLHTKEFEKLQNILSKLGISEYADVRKSIIDLANKLDKATSQKYLEVDIDAFFTPENLGLFERCCKIIYLVNLMQECKHGKVPRLFEDDYKLEQEYKAWRREHRYRPSAYKSPIHFILKKSKHRLFLESDNGAFIKDGDDKAFIHNLASYLGIRTYTFPLNNSANGDLKISDTEPFRFVDNSANGARLNLYFVRCERDLSLGIEQAAGGSSFYGPARYFPLVKTKEINVLSRV